MTNGDNISNQKICWNEGLEIILFLRVGYVSSRVSTHFPNKAHGPGYLKIDTGSSSGSDSFTTRSPIPTLSENSHPRFNCLRAFGAGELLKFLRFNNLLWQLPLVESLGEPRFMRNASRERLERGVSAIRERTETTGHLV